MVAVTEAVKAEDWAVGSPEAESVEVGMVEASGEVMGRGGA